MKLSFSPADRVQAPVVPDQIELRNARPPHYPIGRWLAGVSIAVLAIVGGWWWLTSTRIYSYGVVETGF